jgi:SAM-dependent methyltransferase
MAHTAQQEFCMSVKEKFPESFQDKAVLDAGCLDINGNNRYLFERCQYLGVDIVPGKNVDIVSKIHKLTFVDGFFDTIISTECFEHDKHWKSSVSNLLRMLKPNGLFLFTCATTGRKEHGTRRSNPHDSPTSKVPGWMDYYKNLTAEDFRSAFNLEERFSACQFNTRGTDLRFWGIKA